jgi:hypothetical protein
MSSRSKRHPGLDPGSSFFFERRPWKGWIPGQARDDGFGVINFNSTTLVAIWVRIFQIRNAAHRRYFNAKG